MKAFAEGKAIALEKKLKPMAPPPRTDSNAHTSSEAAATAAAFVE